MANGNPLPDGTRVIRGCSRGYDKGEVTSSAFAMRVQERKELKISVGWVECPYAAVNAQNLDAALIRMRNIPVNPPYAILPSLNIRQIRRGGQALDAIEDGHYRNPCHCGIAGFSGTAAVDLELQADLAEIANRLPVLCAPD